MRKLYTAFKGKNNTSSRLLSGITGQKMFLTNSFPALEREISALTGCFDIIIMFGADKSLRDCVRVECTAALKGEQIETDYPAATLAQKYREAGIRCCISKQTRRSLCNAAYYHMLKRNANTVFVHIPSIGAMTEPFLDQLAQMAKQTD